MVKKAPQIVTQSALPSQHKCINKRLNQSKSQSKRLKIPRQQI
ncbi:hypothetical protein CSC17_2314 [Klebsiella oxytoca]|nr:hypothetical protein CSC17_2314 [Klebsiella oxytoca]